jgi:hypothetical protein
VEIVILVTMNGRPGMRLSSGDRWTASRIDVMSAGVLGREASAWPGSSDVQNATSAAAAMPRAMFPGHGSSSRGGDRTDSPITPATLVAAFRRRP